jgi:hypothetical protein
LKTHRCLCKRATIVNTGSAMDRHMATGLSGQPRRQVGRSANDPMRIAEQQRRRGNYQADPANRTDGHGATNPTGFGGSRLCATGSACFKHSSKCRINARDIDWQRQQQRDAANYRSKSMVWQKRDTANSSSSSNWRPSAVRRRTLSSSARSRRAKPDRAL